MSEPLYRSKMTDLLGQRLGETVDAIIERAEGRTHSTARWQIRRAVETIVRWERADRVLAIGFGEPAPERAAREVERLLRFLTYVGVSRGSPAQVERAIAEWLAEEES